MRIPTLLLRAAALLGLALQLPAQGLTWTQVNTGMSANLQYTSGAYGGGRYTFLAYGNASGGGFATEAVTSTDGNLWTKSTLPNGAIARGLIYANGLFVAPGEFNGANATNPNTIMTSPDGSTWTAHSAGAGTLWGVAYNGQRFVAVGLQQNGTNLATSTDGTSWTRGDVGAGSTNLSSVIASTLNRRFIAWYVGADTYFHSTDGTTWTAAQITGRNAGASYRGFAVTDSGFVAYSTAPGETTAKLHESADGISWTDSGTVTLPNNFTGTGHNSLGITHHPSTGQAQAVIIGGYYDFNTSTSTAYALDSGGALASWNAQSFGTGDFVENRFVARLNGAWWLGNSTTQLFTTSGISGGGSGGGNTGGGNSGGSGGSGNTGGGGSTTSGHFVNVSIRANAGIGDGTLILGAVLSGPATATKSLLVRAAGPALNGFNINGALADPSLSLFQQSTLFGSNDNWDSALADTISRLGAFAFTAGGKDAALLASLPAGPLSAHVGGGSGVALIELYDADASSTDLAIANVSARTTVGSGDGVLVLGFVVAGSSPQKVLVRGIGAGLGAFNIGGVLTDTMLEIHSGNTVVASNDDWSETSAPVAEQNGVGAFALNAGATDSAIVTTLAPGSYTVVVSGKGATTGVALVEIYRLP